MSPMMPTPQDSSLLVCKKPGCTWTYAFTGTGNATEIARYHAIQVHNDPQAVRDGRY